MHTHSAQANEAIASLQPVTSRETSPTSRHCPCTMVLLQRSACSYCCPHLHYRFQLCSYPNGGLDTERGADSKETASYRIRRQ